jgi:hypothetical protein
MSNSEAGSSIKTDILYQNIVDVSLGKKDTLSENSEVESSVLRWF